MVVATVTSKGQITIPASVRAMMGIEAGHKIEFVQTAQGKMELIVKNSPISTLKGFIKATRTVSIDEMNEAIAQGAVESGLDK